MLILSFNDFYYYKLCSRNNCENSFHFQSFLTARLHCSITVSYSDVKLHIEFLLRLFWRRSCYDTPAVFPWFFLPPSSPCWHSFNALNAVQLVPTSFAPCTFKPCSSRSILLYAYMYVYVCECAYRIHAYRRNPSPLPSTPPVTDSPSLPQRRRAWWRSAGAWRATRGRRWP